MKRRSLLSLAALSPAIAASPALACSVALKTPRSDGLQNNQVRKLFEAWWERDSEKFRAIFTHHLMEDGSAMEPKLAEELRASNPLPTDRFAIFDRFFTDTNKLYQLTLIVNTGAGIVVGCSESNFDRSIEGDCSGMPRLHLFLVEMETLNPRSIEHLASADTIDINRFSFWTSA